MPLRNADEASNGLNEVFIVKFDPTFSVSLVSKTRPKIIWASSEISTLWPSLRHLDL